MDTSGVATNMQTTRVVAKMTYPSDHAEGYKGLTWASAKDLAKTFVVRFAFIMGKRLTRNLKIQSQAKAAAPHYEQLMQDAPSQWDANSLSDWEQAIPMDLKEFAAEAEYVFSQIPDSLPNLVITTIPCVDTSLAGDGLGLRGHRSGLVFKLMVVMRALRSAYTAAGWKPTTPGDAPFAWILETSPIFETDTRPLILEAKQVFTDLLGNPVQPDAAMAGSSAYRKTMLFSNMGREDQFNSIQDWTPANLPETTSAARLVQIMMQTPRLSSAQPPQIWRRHARPPGAHPARSQPPAGAQ
eukprot:jgi/Tetstr1/433582/TSEL_022849.t1